MTPTSPLAGVLTGLVAGLIITLVVVSVVWVINRRRSARAAGAIAAAESLDPVQVSAEEREPVDLRKAA